MSKAASTIQLRIELRRVSPKVWRRVLVPSSMTLAKLHRVIQAVMGWEDDHLHEFEIGQRRYGEPNPDWDEPEEVVSERKVTVEAALRGFRSALYTYDFGDDWEHDIKVEEPMAKYLGLEAPVCVDGKNACPPEDCGGPGGYKDLLRAAADPTDPEHEAICEWLGGVWDPAAFNLDDVNKELSRLR